MDAAKIRALLDSYFAFEKQVALETAARDAIEQTLEHLRAEWTQTYHDLKDAIGGTVVLYNGKAVALVRDSRNGMIVADVCVLGRAASYADRSGDGGDPDAPMFVK